MPSSSVQNSPESRSFRYIFFFSFGFLSAWFLSKRKTPGQQSAETIYPQTPTDDGRTQPQRPPPIAVRIESYPPATATAQESTDRRLRNLRDWGNLVATCLTALFAGGLLVVTSLYAKYTYEMWVEMQQQTRIQRDAYISGQRPWMKITNVTSRGNSELGGLSFSGFGHFPFPTVQKTATMQLEISTKNVGHSVAELFVDFELFLPLWENQGPTAHGYSTGYANVVANEKKRFCEESSKKEFPVRFMVFPEEPHIWDGGASAIISPGIINHLGNADVVLPVVIICANYRYPGAKDTFQTSALFEAFRNDDRSRFFTVGQNVPTNQFWLERNRSEDGAR
jgi:hypothetical protein